MEYAKEPFNFKLFVLKMLGKWQQFVLCTLAGALAFGGIYYLYKVVYAPAREYEAKATYYIEYAKDPELGNEATYFNEYTLNSWVLEDVFIEQVQEVLSKKVSAEEVGSYLTVTLPSDVRVMQVKVVTAEPEFTIELLKAYDVAFQSFAERQREINHIALQGMSNEASQIKVDVRTQRAFVLGGVLGFVLGGLYIMLKYLLDDGIYVPELLAKRHGLKALGADCSEELASNINYAVRNYDRVAITGIGDTPNLTQVQAKFKEISADKEWVLVPSMVQCPEAGAVLRACDGCILVVTAGNDKSVAIDRALSYYAQQDVNVIGAVLWNTEDVLLKRYEK